MLRRMSNKPSVLKRWFLQFTSQASSNMDVLHLETPNKSESDKKLYRALQLSNGLRALLISEAVEDGRVSRSDDAGPASIISIESLEENMGKLSACAVAMRVGSFYAPKKYQGIAHFLEHMVFLGSKKYPEENAFMAHMAKTGGSFDAHTVDETTNFQFEVEVQYLDKTLDILMSLMKAPLMSINSMTRERSAVQSEFDRAFNSDGMRFNQLIASMANEEYPHGTFGCGNLKSLAENINDEELHMELQNFFRKHYGSNRMTVCIQSTLPLDELQEILLRHCSDIQRSLEEPMDVSNLKYQDAFQERFYRDVLLVKQINKGYSLNFFWVLPSMHGYYKVKPCKFISDLIVFEGVGSLSANLRNRLWAETITSSVEPNSIFTKFQVRIYLTTEGFQHLDEVIGVTFAWIRMICSNTQLQSKYKEVQQLEEINFRFQMEFPAGMNTAALSDALHIYPIKDVLTGDKLFFEYNIEVVKMVQQLLSEFRFQICISSDLPYGNYSYDQKEHWFGTQFAQITMPEKWKNMWTNPEPHPELKFPAPNPFVPTDFAIHWVKAGKPRIPRHPKALIRNELCELWFRQDDTFLLPEGVIHINIITPVMRQNVKDYLAGILFTQLVELELAGQMGQAEKAGLTYGFTNKDTGFKLKVSGYNEKMSVLCEMIVNAIKKLEINSAQVMSLREIQKQSILRSLIDPTFLNEDLLINVMQQKGWTLLEKYEAIKSLTPQDVKRIKDTFHKQMYIQALIQGNFTEQQARQIIENVLNIFQSEKFENYADMQNRTVRLPHGEFFLRVKAINVDDVNSVLTNYYQLGPTSVTTTVMLELLDMMTWEPYFNQLRTKEQMCYDLQTVHRISNCIGGYIFSIKTQENRFAADFVEKRVEKFRLSVPSIIRQMSQEEYEQFRQALINKKKKANLCLVHEVSHNWSEIESQEYFFDRFEIQINTIAAIEKKDLLEFLELCTVPNLRKLSVHVIGSSPSGQPQSDENVSIKNSDEEEMKGKVKLKFIGDPRNSFHIMNIAEFKKNLYVYPPMCDNLMMKK